MLSYSKSKKAFLALVAFLFVFGSFISPLATPQTMAADDSETKTLSVSLKSPTTSPSSSTSATIAYVLPSDGLVYIYKNGSLIHEEEQTSQGTYNYTISGLAPGNYTFEVDYISPANQILFNYVTYTVVATGSAPATKDYSVSNVQTSNLTTSSATITFTTKIDTTSLIDCSPKASNGNTDKTMAKNHSLTLTGLTANTTYTCHIHTGFLTSANEIDNEYNSDNFTFKTTEPNVTTYYWSETWSACSGNLKTKSYICKSSAGVTVADSYCSSPKPASVTESCVGETTKDYSVSNVQTSNLTTSSATITFTTKIDTTSLIDCSPKASNGNTDKTMAKNHSLTLTGLTANTTYTCHIHTGFLTSANEIDNEYNSSDFTFKTAGESASTPSPTPTYSWQYTNWTTCTNGLQARTAKCVTGSTQVNDSNCASLTKESLSQICSTITYTWKYSDWSSCVSGLKTRTANCYSGNLLVNDNYCANLAKESLSQSCTAATAPAISNFSISYNNTSRLLAITADFNQTVTEYVYFDSQKKVTTNNVTNDRSSVNVDLVGAGSVGDHFVYLEVCNTSNLCTKSSVLKYSITAASTAYTWKYSDWSVCVNNTQTRTANCYSGNALVSASYCASLTKESLSQSCTSSKPDLIITKVTSTPLNPKSGDMLTLTVTVKNIGDKDVLDQIDFSPAMPSYTINGLKAGEEKSITIYSATSYSRPGLVEHFTDVDPFNKIDESNENNNTNTLQITVGPNFTGDGTYDLAHWRTVRLNNGLTLLVDGQNISSQTPYKVHFRVFDRNNAEIFDTPLLSAGDTYQGNGYNIKVNNINSYGNIDYEWTANVTVKSADYAQKPDLTPVKLEIKNLTHPNNDQWLMYDTLEITIGFKNIGSADSGSFYYTLNENNNTSGYRSNILNIEAGEDYEYKFIGAYDKNVTTAQSLTYSLKIDSENSVQESSENNNILEKTIVISGSNSDIPWYFWYATNDWSTCVNGVQTRSVVCHKQEGTVESAVADSLCSEHSTWPKPATSQACVANNGYSWGWHSWSECVNGQQTREVFCMDSREATVADSFCTAAKPAASQTCTLSPDNVTGQRLSGRLLLATEDHGRVYYVSPSDHKKYEITFGNVMKLFQDLALGISNADLNHVLINPNALSADKDSDGDGYSDKSEATYGYNPYLASNPETRGNDKMQVDTALSNRLIGKLLLATEDRGRIWYVDQAAKRWEVTWENVMNLFTSLSLGITNEDLGKINTGN